MTTLNSASATSGGATAVGVVADTQVIGNQAVVVHIPANTDGQVLKVSIDASVSNTGIAFSQSGAVTSTGLQGSTAIAPLGVNPTPLQTATGPTAAITNTAPSIVDLRNADYALANSGDALAIGVQALTIVDGMQRVKVIIDDNSSGNRIEVTFHISIANSGTAQASSGAASATGQQGDLLAAGSSDGLGTASVDSAARSRSGAATAVGVDATTAIRILQSAELDVGDNSSQNQLDEFFTVDVANSGSALATTGGANATGLAGDVVAGGPSGKAGGPVALQASGRSVALRQENNAVGRSGDASSTGLTAATSLYESQGVSVVMNPGSRLPLQVTSSDKVVNFGLARSTTGDVKVIANIVPTPEAQPSPNSPPNAPPNAGAPGAQPTPTPATTARPLGVLYPPTNGSPWAIGTTSAAVQSPSSGSMTGTEAQLERSTTPTAGNSRDIGGSFGSAAGEASSAPQPQPVAGGPMLLVDDGHGHKTARTTLPRLNGAQDPPPPADDKDNWSFAIVLLLSLVPAGASWLRDRIER